MRRALSGGVSSLKYCFLPGQYFAQLVRTRTMVPGPIGPCGRVGGEVNDHGWCNEALQGDPLSGRLALREVNGRIEVRPSVLRREHQLWFPLETGETERDVPHEESGPSTLRLWSLFAPWAVLTGVSGWVIARAGTSISMHTGLPETLVGALFTAISTSLPELVTSVAAVRQGSPTLAAGGIIGGNAFDVLFLAFADIAYRPGSPPRPALPVLTARR